VSIAQQKKIEELERRVSVFESPQWRAQFIEDALRVVMENMAQQPKTLTLPKKANG
jgi:2-methylcitrate dehydratase PrpD